jgi:phosphatidylserine/phosphatidylglycerophosphate/cardiolipin synthase-like enzyme
MKFATTLIITCILLVGATYEAQAKRKKSLAHQIEARIDEALVKAPVDLEVCFSPEEPCDTKLVKFVRTAEKSIDIAIYDINLDALVHELLLKSQKIPVRILVDRRQAAGGHSSVPLLIKAGANVRFGHQRGIMHNKFVVVDGKAVETGSFNHTFHASKANNENQIYLMNPDVVSRYQKRFEKIWAVGDGVVK